ncbi:hypothetical protein [Propioniciclava sinopodophylli]|uniref:hypothetical protein n=1 Tax=Propioniciclava sinopodophylli TaxID=1837344 RepID=UPI0024933577|nr:hypothetical protein [Propioniciclava sinopodophylli]
MSDASDEVVTIERPRWGLIVSLVVAGLALLVLGWFWAEGDFPRSYLSGVAVNVGTALLLASLLVWFERNFMKRVRGSQAATVKEVAKQAAQNAVAEFNSTFAELNERVNALAEGRTAETAATIDAITSNPTYDVVREALRAAAKIKAIRTLDEDEGVIIVPAGTSADSPLVRVQWHHEREPYRGHASYQNSDGSPEAVELGYVASDSTIAGSRIEWISRTDLVDAIDSLKQQMVRDGLAVESRQLDAQALVANLQTALHTALASRRAEPGSHFDTNTIYEWLWNGWLITERGLEAPDTPGPLIDGTIYPGRVTPAQFKQGGIKLPPKPEGIEQTDWDAGERRVRAHFLHRFGNIFNGQY